jgi:LysR family glycine cleavage system transcriptional activator
LLRRATIYVLMSRKLPPLNGVRAFEAAARHVSFTKAAEELHVTHGAVSRHVALLEEWLGTPLFRRSASQLTLTDAGRSYAAEATSMLDRLAIASMHLVERAVPTALAVNGPPTFTMRWLLARLSGFQRLRPDVQIQLTTSLSPVNFQEHNYSVAIRGAHTPLASCRSVRFMTELIVPVCHTDLVESGGLREPDDLRRHTLLGYITEPYAWPEWLAAAGVPGLQSAGVLRFEQMYFALQAASDGLGVVLVPLFLVVDDIVSGRLCTPFGSLAAMQRSYYANTPAEVVRNGPADTFCEWLVREGRDTEKSIESWAIGMGWQLPSPHND